MDAGPPLRMMPLGFHRRTKSTETVGGWISEYTRASRTRRAMSWVNWDPKSRMRIRSVMVGRRVEGEDGDTTTTVPRPPRASSAGPLGGIQLDELDALRRDVEQRCGWRAEEPSAPFARVDHQGIAPRLHLLHVRASVDDDGVGMHG